ncbi:hypothetical protein D3C87_1582680 [compost metagenome]
MTGRPIPRIFNRHPVTGLHQQLCTKADSLLRATGDQNLFSRALHAAGTAQIRGDHPAQACIACRVAVAQLLKIRFAPESRIQLGPDLEWKQVERRNTDPKCPGRTARRTGQMVVFDPGQRVVVDNFAGWIHR